MFQFDDAIIVYENGKLITHTTDGESIEFEINKGNEAESRYYQK